MPKKMIPIKQFRITHNFELSNPELSTLRSALLTQEQEQRRHNTKSTTINATWIMLAKIEDAMGMAPTINLAGTDAIPY